MSTYLVAFIVSNYKSINKLSKYNISVEIAAKPESVDNGECEYALEESIKIIDFFVDYFNVSYPMPKSSQQFMDLFSLRFILNIVLFSTNSYT